MPLPEIALTNVSTVLTDDQVTAVVPALQKQVTQDFKAYWNLDCSLSFLPKQQSLPAGWWQLLIVDDPDQAGALGYHELSAQGTPLGKVFAKLDAQAGSSWTVTASHELLEMLADPWINTCVHGDDSRIYALEVADAVEADAYGYLIDGVEVSDFVTPRWFEAAVAGDRFSFKGTVTKPLELAPGGYISVLGADGWTQITARAGRLADMVTSVLVSAPEGSRRYRRATRMHWKKTERPLGKV